MTNVSIGTLSLYEIFAYFFFYAFLGWIAEVCYHAIKRGDFANRGFLNGPLCPIYGCGVTLILLILGNRAETPWAVLLIGIALPTLLELVGGWAMETFFHNKWWDYSDRKLNFKGYICLEFSILWGLAAVCVICVLHPPIKRLTNLIPDPYATVVISVLLAAFVADIVVTVLQLCKFNSKLKELDEVTRFMRAGSDAVGKKLAEATIAVGEKTGEAKEKLAKAHEKAVDAIVEKMPKRILNAFPTLRSRKNPNAVPLAKESAKRIRLRKRNRAKTGAENDNGGGAENTD
ncbi:MAG: hypothetical protein NC184_06875 [Roseburia sp.]|nr:hypothetical protein [Roseburia sp.]